MYIQITERCNFSCEHCCMNATEEGRDMSLETYQAAIKLAEELGEYVVIGGGEPTLHPNFWEMIGIAIGSSIEGVWLATNGSQTQTSIALAKLAQKGVLGVALSQDIYHDPIDPIVVQAFTKESSTDSYRKKETDDCREIRDVSDGETTVGRALVNGIGSKEDCSCEGLFVDPSGKLWSCGCEEISFGNVRKFGIPPDFWDREWEENGFSCYAAHKRRKEG